MYVVNLLNIHEIFSPNVELEQSVKIPLQEKHLPIYGIAILGFYAIMIINLQRVCSHSNEC